jgi:ribosomal protein S18 acetylase RimI-like enzyme
VTTAEPSGVPGRPRADVVVRELRWSDFDAIRDSYYLLYEERSTAPDIGITLFQHRPSLDDEVSWFADLYRKALSGQSLVVVAERDGIAVGHCTVHPVGATPESEQAHVGELGILVHRDHRGVGVGRALLNAALRQCRGKFEIVHLSVFSTNVRARRLYEELGFVRIGSRSRVVRRGDRYFDEDLMVLDLARTVANR